MDWRLVLLVLLLAASGCLEENTDELQPQEDPGHSETPPENTTASNATDLALNRTIAMPAGGWVSDYRPLHAPTSTLTVNATLTVTLTPPEGETPILFVSHPEPTLQSSISFPLVPSGVFPGPGELEIGNKSEPLVYTHDPGPRYWSTGGEFSGIHVAIAANAPWDARVKMNVSDSSVANDTAFQARGTNASFVHGPVLGPTDVGGHSGVFSMSHQVEREGWTQFHLELEPNEAVGPAIERAGARSLEVRLPGGQGLASAGYGREVKAQNATSTSRTGDWDFVGQYLGPPGTFEATVAEAELNHRVQPVLVHLPINASGWPDAVYTGSYSGFEGDATDS